MAKASKPPSPAAIAMRDAAAELERQAARLRAKADLLDGGGASKVKTVSKAKPKKAKAKTARKARKAKASKRKAPRAKAKPMPAGALAKLKGAHANGAAHPVVRRA